MGGRGSSSGRAGGKNKRPIRYSTYEDDKFFGEIILHPNKESFVFNHNPNDYTAIPVFSKEHITDINGNKVLIVGNDKAVYLKEWQMKPVLIGKDSGYAVKLTRNYYRPYTFKNSFSQVSIDKDLSSFDDIKKLAKSQESTFYRKSKQ